MMFIYLHGISLHPATVGSYVVQKCGDLVQLPARGEGIIVLLELWVNFDHKYCFLAYSLELALIFFMLVQFPSVCLVFVIDRRTENYRGGHG